MGCGRCADQRVVGLRVHEQVKQQVKWQVKQLVAGQKIPVDVDGGLWDAMQVLGQKQLCQSDENETTHHTQENCEWV